MTNHLDNQLTTKTSSNSVMMRHVESLGKNGMEWWERIRVMSLQGWVHGCWSNVGTDHVFCQHAIMSAHLQHVMLPLAEILNVCLRINWYVSVLMFCVYSEDVEIKDLTHIPTHHASKSLCFHISCFCDYQKRRPVHRTEPSLQLDMSILGYEKVQDKDVFDWFI